MKKSTPIPTPTVILLRKDLSEGCSVEFTADPYGKHFGIFVPHTGKKMFRMHAKKEMKQDVKAWRMIQRERKRLGLDPLTEEEMIV